MDRKFAPQEETVVMHPGDRLFLCTDGLIEGMSPQEELFGYERVQDFLFSSSAESPDGQCDRLLETYFTFCQERILTDDLTILLICREEGGSAG
jgi:serine phosphatase RsbU (regulator of sigma subunit)